MPLKMLDRMDAQEERLTAMEIAMHQTFRELTNLESQFGSRESSDDKENGWPYRVDYESRYLLRSIVIYGRDEDTFGQVEYGVCQSDNPYEELKDLVHQGMRRSTYRSLSNIWATSLVAYIRRLGGESKLLTQSPDSKPCAWQGIAGQHTKGTSIGIVNQGESHATRDVSSATPMYKEAVLGDDETLNEVGDVLPIETKEEKGESTLEYGAIGCSKLSQPQFYISTSGIALGLDDEQGKSIGVRLGDSHRVATIGRCQSVEIQLGNFQTVVAPYVLELGSLDMILGGKSWELQGQKPDSRKCLQKIVAHLQSLMEEKRSKGEMSIGREPSREQRMEQGMKREHLENLSIVLQVLQEHKFVVNEKKCAFGTRQGSNRNFIVGYRKIAKPLTELTKKEGFKWTIAAKETFEELKRVMTPSPLLILPDFLQPLEIDCHASRVELGVLLMKNHRPIAYYMVQHWRLYLLGRSFKVFSDERSLGYLLCATEWLAKLLGYQFEVIYKLGPQQGCGFTLNVFEEGELRQMNFFPTWVQEQQATELQLLVIPKDMHKIRAVSATASACIKPILTPKNIILRF
ncbi:hypothetical protein V8G54_008929 [Vigna mungo]|uniref:Reverse transcriptase/retrotransposon-derived protein RNase H-like domain-containing protein n=1 Tax=Vigna mungo TaxID=3915 RepID=A0AAQ3P6L5_VIGMU